MVKDLSTEKTRVGKVGEDITILCSYDKTRFSLYDKYWCLGKSKSNCKILCESKWSERHCHDSRMSIQDNRAGHLVITMRNLVLEDRGTYWCGIRKQWNPMILMNLQITDVPKVYRMPQNIKHTMKEGEDLTMNCLYDKSSLVSYRKFLCHQVSSTQCNMLADTKGYLSDKYNKRIQIIDDHLGTISFIIKTIVFEDSGIYSCGIEVEKLHTLASFEITVELDQKQNNYFYTTFSFTTAIATTTHFAVLTENSTQWASEVLSSFFYNEWSYWRWICFLLMISALIPMCLCKKRIMFLPIMER
ncbi:uncharacterized protein LOC130356595 [Hyla sarda]|uniref:uncharacterized protein LOC130356595 n=1 Tax=Hyla sarda TaxID=327740 RepID=UPI0024C3B726|nr:uncharacterized protein LOC130356595 [Hyla sarda]XP_056414321.1 uncharacterized protein LOC130356595 [Hyla sarda]XP_056414322.1 uncharacterized protein LOC130356595 [Hyla sarda]